MLNSCSSTSRLKLLFTGGHLGRQFVLGEDITKAKMRAKEIAAEGYTYSYDMLGEAAKTEADVKAYLASAVASVLTKPANLFAPERKDSVG